MEYLLIFWLCSAQHGPGSCEEVVRPVEVASQAGCLAQQLAAAEIAARSDGKDRLRAWTCSLPRA